MPEQGRELPRSVLQLAPGVRDGAARDRLWAEVERAIRSLHDLQTDPIVIAASPNRFNDIYYSEWQAVRFGGFFTERHEYAPHIDYEADLRKGPAGARAAREVLDRLEAAGWQDLFARSFDVEWSDCILALVVQQGLGWLVFSGSNISEANHVFALWGSPPMRYFGECLERFDCDLQDDPPLRFQPALPDEGQESAAP